MNHSYSYKPSIFFINTFLISWTFWLVAMYVSWNQSMHKIVFYVLLIKNKLFLKNNFCAIKFYRKSLSEIALAMINLTMSGSLPGIIKSEIWQALMKREVRIFLVCALVKDRSIYHKCHIKFSVLVLMIFL